MLRTLPLLLLPLNLLAQVFHGSHSYAPCLNLEYTVSIGSDSSLIYIEQFHHLKPPRKYKNKCPGTDQILFYAYGRIFRASDSVYSSEVSGNAVLNFEYCDIAGHYLSRNIGTDSVALVFDSIKPWRIPMRSAYHFRVRYENGKDTVYSYNTLCPNMDPWKNPQDTSTYANLNTVFIFRYDHRYFGPGKMLYIDIGLRDPLTGKSIEFPVPYGKTPYFSWYSKPWCWNGSMNITPEGIRLCDEVLLKKIKDN